MAFLRCTWWRYAECWTLPRFCVLGIYVKSGQPGLFGSREAEKWAGSVSPALAITLWGTEDCRATLMALQKGNIQQGRVRHQIWPEIWTRGTGVAESLHSEHRLTVPERSKPTKTLLAPGKFLPCRQHQFPSSIVSPKRCANTFGFVYISRQPWMSSPEQL